MKKHNERNAGRKRHGDKLKIGKSVSVDPDDFEEMVREFGSLSRALRVLWKNYKNGGANGK